MADHAEAADVLDMIVGVGNRPQARNDLRCDLPGGRWSSGRADLVQQSFADIERGGAQLPRQGQQAQRQILYIAGNLAKIILALTEFLRSGAALDSACARSARCPCTTPGA